jgi:hypothetical protein
MGELKVELSTLDTNEGYLTKGAFKVLGSNQLSYRPFKGSVQDRSSGRLNEIKMTAWVRVLRQ